MRIPVLFGAVTVSLSTLVLLASTGCGGSGGGGGGNAGGSGGGTATTPLAACHALCVVEGKGASCPAETQQTCTDICDSLDFTLADCGTKAVAYFTCAQGETWACSGTASTPSATDGKCTAESSAYATACTP